MKKRKKNTAKPIIRFRLMMLWVVLLAVLVSGPLVVVWKQVYINDASLQMDSMADSLVVLKKEIAALHLESERLSGIERIETLAREKLQLHYPSSGQIVIVKIHDTDREHRGHNPLELLAFLRKAIAGDNG